MSMGAYYTFDRSLGKYKISEDSFTYIFGSEMLTSFEKYFKSINRPPLFSVAHWYKTLPKEDKKKVRMLTRGENHGFGDPMV